MVRICSGHILVFFFLLVMQQEIRAQQSGGAVPSETLTQIASADNSTVYSFNYPSVNAHGEPVVLSSALFAWTPADRQETDSIESLHIYCFSLTGA